MLSDRVRIGRKKGIEYIGEVYLAQDDDFVKVGNNWVYRGSELEIEIPHIIQGEEVTSYDYMFYDGGGYSATPVTRVDSNNTRVTSMSRMFYNSKATSLDLSSFNTSNVYNMNYMFYGSQATSLDLSSFDTSSVTSMYSIFSSSLATLGVARTLADKTKFESSANKPAGLTFILPATDDDFSGTTDGTFQYIGSETTVFIPHIIKGVNVTSYNQLFAGTSVTRVISTNPNVTNMYAMFYGSQATSLNLSSFDTSNVTDMSLMFYNSKATSLDLSSFDTSNVTNMSSMFRDSPATSLDLSSFDTSNVTSMGYMFYNSQATSLDLSNFNTSNVTNMSYMFYSSQATSLDLSNFNTSNVTSMAYMFRSTIATTLDLSSFNLGALTSSKYMFTSTLATTGWARTATDRDKLNATSGKPATLVFVVKP